MSMRNSLLTVIAALLTVPSSEAQAPSIVLSDGGVQFPDGSILTSAAGSYANVIVVAKSGGHFETIQGALDSITDNSYENRYLIWIAPGIYQERVSMKGFVDMRGSGRDATLITHSGYTTCDLATLRGSDKSELRALTVESSGFSDCNVAIFNSDASPRLTDLTVRSIRGGMNVGILNQASSYPRLRFVDVEACSPIHYEQAQCIGIWNKTDSSSGVYGGRVIGSNGVSENYGILSDGPSTLVAIRSATVQAGGPSSATKDCVHLRNSAQAIIHNSVLATLSGYAVFAGEGCSSTVANSMLWLGVAGAGSHKCVGAFDEEWDPLEANCQPPRP